MVYEERNLWSSLIVSVIAMIVYVIVTLQAAGGGPLTDVDWVPIMLWTIGASIVGAIVVSIVWGMLAGMRDPDGVGKSDQRDRDISQMGNRVGYAFLVIAGLGVLVLCAFQADWFWIANTMFFGFAVSTIIGGIASVIAYRRGLV
jgi:MFS family permease